MALPEPDELVKLISQETISTNGEKVEKWTLNVWAINDLRARQRARQWTRRNAPTARNVFTPRVKGDEGEQSTFGDFISNAIDADFRETEVIVVKSL